MAVMQGIEQRRDRDKARRNQEDGRRPGDSEHWEILSAFGTSIPKATKNSVMKNSRMLMIFAITSKLYGRWRSPPRQSRHPSPGKPSAVAHPCDRKAPAQ